MIRLLYFIILINFLYSCNSKYKGFSKSDQGIYFKLHMLGDDEVIIGNRIVGSDIIIRAISDEDTSIVFKRKYHFSHIGFGDKVDQLFSGFHTGDSASFWIESAELLYEITGMKIDLDTIQGDLLLDLRIDHQWTEEAYKEYVKQQELIEYRELENYLKQQKQSFEFYDGIFVFNQEKGTGPLPVKGKVMDLHYKGYFINGFIFDSTYDRNAPFEYSYGVQQQVIDGFEIVLKNKREGDKLKIVIPSRYAFGDKGSSNGIVPPFTTVIYDLEIVKIRTYKNETT